jgi:hypothetical protein
MRNGIFFRVEDRGRRRDSGRGSVVCAAGVIGEHSGAPQFGGLGGAAAVPRGEIMRESILAIGLQAIKLAEGDERIALGKLRDPAAETGSYVSIERARRIACEDPNLIYAYMPTEKLPVKPDFEVGGEG